ncbi:hypothetical protein PUNSTDRAFT_78010 [Punctularia strigosozonata HHB-11173 SS5]|uniref:Uncharacterized protein n=1 Tax=Punctularia strigosozonata (strain HHB-11173) TaxID=741275 RepID=R7S169_PUNST|nr:uncharacterized protein PUNSTDRAFT_78010 [Punctularia strigosozonata HHB-11173 SS5]EIN03537.1 hypothetical protein PUNSTDRAFT_78010 [Punctularia strigosozonata HHB-11173 SS5]
MHVRRFHSFLSHPLTFLPLSFIPIILDTYLMVLTTRKFISAHREGWGRTPILSLVVRDGIWAFVVLFRAYGPCGQPTSVL